MPLFSGSIFMACPDGISLAVTNALPGIMQLSFLRHAALHSAGAKQHCHLKSSIHARGGGEMGDYH